MRIGFHVGPFYFSQRVGRTQAQRRAAAKVKAAKAAKAAERQRWHSVMTTNGVVTGHEPGAVLVRITSEVGQYRRMLTGRTLAVKTAETFPVGAVVQFRERVGDHTLLSIDQVQP